jgi:nucleotide-binding universal stress UspA family protein
MSNRFQNILVPVDFSPNTELAIAKALAIGQGDIGALHLFHVQRIIHPGFMHYLQYYITGYSRRQMNEDREKVMDSLDSIRRKIMQQHPDIPVYTSASFGDPVEEAIIRKASRLKSDLIIVGKKSHHSIFPFLNTVVPSRLASRSGRPVLTAKPGSLHQEIKTVVIPIGGRSPERKLEVLEALRKKSKLQVRLVTFEQGEKNIAVTQQALFQAIRRLKTHQTIPVDYEVLAGTNRARSLLKYCNKVGADVLIVHPDSETRISNWSNRHISDLLPADSKTSVLAVSS